jgi:hypothetical protein
MIVFGQGGTTQIGCGIMVMDMEMFGDGGTIIIGQDPTHISMVFMTHLIHFGVITTHSIMDMVTAAIHTGIHHIGDHIITGTMVISTELIIITIIHSLVQEEVHRRFLQEIVILTIT